MTAKEKIRKLPCLVCGKTPSDASHVKTYAASGINEEWNLYPLCRIHHSEQHRIGIITFIEKHPAVKQYLFKNGFTLDEYCGKKYLYHPKMLGDKQ